MVLSSTIAFSFTWGTVGLATGSVSTGFCSGLVAMALAITLQFQGSKLTKGMSLIIPTQIVQEAVKEDTTTIQGGS